MINMGDSERVGDTLWVSELRGETKHTQGIKLQHVFNQKVSTTRFP